MGKSGSGYGIVFCREWMPYLESLDDKKCGQLFKALLKLGFDGEATDFNDPALHAAYQIIGTAIMYDIDKYKTTCENNRKRAQMRRKQVNTETGEE